MKNRIFCRISSLILSVLICFSLPITSYAEEPEDNTDIFSIEELKDNLLPYLDMKIGEKGEADFSEYEQIEVSSEEDLKKLAENCILDEWSRDKYVKLTKDITLSNYKDIQVPTFGGIFDGNSYSIYGLAIDGNGSSIGLFRYIQASGIVKDLNVNGDVTPNMSASQVGIIAGTNYGNISNCKVTGIVVGDTEVGGIAGLNAQDGIISNCESKAYITAKHSAGGIAGNNIGTILDCDNNGGINLTVSDIKIDVSELSLERLTSINSTSNTAVFTDVGGIAGVSSGNIARCVNRAKVGYSHVGYNIGGIVGRLSQGYLSKCENYGSILGRKDVGGIAGQMEPFLQVEYMLDGITRLDNAVNVLFDMVDETIDDGDKYSKQSADLLSEISDALLEANHISKELPDTDEGISLEDQKNKINSQTDNLISLKDDMKIIAEYSDKFSDLIEKSSEELSEDLKAVTRQSREVYNLSSAIRNSIMSYQGITVTDGSTEEEEITDESEDITETDLVFENYGRLVASSNYGTVEADSAVGGIVGRISTEYDFDLEDDIDITGSQSLYVNATAKAIIRDNKSNGEVIAKKDFAGGVAGYAEYGYLINNLSTAKVSSESGSYIGGIAGESDNNIMLCYACGDVSGKSFVGGIAGKANKVSGCAAFVNVDYTGEKAGMIAGDISEDGEIFANHYVENPVGGIDGIGYASGAEPLSYEEFILLPGLPKEFSNFTIVFLADGNELGRVEAKYGDSIKDKDIPVIPDKEGYYGIWPDYDFSFVTGSRVLEVCYEKWEKSLVSDEKVNIDGVEKPYILIAGEFLPGAELVTEKTGDEINIKVSYKDDAEIARNMGVKEYSGLATIRVALEDTDNVCVETFDGEKWNKVNSDVLGSYITFETQLPGKIKITHTVDYSLYIKIGVIAAVVIGIVVCIVLVNRVKKIKKKLALKKAPKAVIFDLDGTLIDTEKYYRRVWPLALEHFGYHPSDEQILELRSLGRPFAPKKLKEWFGEDFDYDAVRAYRKELFEKCTKDEGVILKPGVMELLDYLKDEGITIAIATATDVERTKKYLDMAGINFYVDKICSAANVKEGKPSPDVYLQAIKQLNLKPENCIAVEDSPNGIKSAYSAGLRVVFVPDQTKDEPEAEKLTWAKVGTADEIINLLKK